MPQKTLVIIHTATLTVPPLTALAQELMPDVRVVNLMDDSMLKDTMAAGRVTAAVTRRLGQYMMIAEDMGADLILNACSSLRQAADSAAQRIATPIAKIDTAMAARAVASAGRIGVAATVQTTLDPTARLIEATAQQQGKTVSVTRCLCAGAFDALVASDGAQHDRIVADALLSLAETVEVIVLAQVSMGRVADHLGGRVAVPVLTSPRLGMEHLAELMGARPVPQGSVR